MEKINKKLTHIDCNSDYYKSLSDKEIQLLKKFTVFGWENLGNCPKHGLHEKITITSYDKLGNKTKYYGACLECFADKGGAK